MSSFSPYVGGRLPCLVFLRAAGPEGVAPRIHWRPVLENARGALGLTLWILYGVTQGNWFIIGSNVVGATLAGIALCCKVRDLK